MVEIPKFTYGPCPECAQGILQVLMTSAGVLVIHCDEENEVWLDPREVGIAQWIDPINGGWRVASGVDITPGTTRLARLDELPDDWPAPAVTSSRDID